MWKIQTLNTFVEGLPHSRPTDLRITLFLLESIERFGLNSSKWIKWIEFKLFIKFHIVSIKI